MKYLLQMKEVNAISIFFCCYFEIEISLKGLTIALLTCWFFLKCTLLKQSAELSQITFGLSLEIHIAIPWQDLPSNFLGHE